MYIHYVYPYVILFHYCNITFFLQHSKKKGQRKGGMGGGSAKEKKNPPSTLAQHPERILL